MVKIKKHISIPSDIDIMILDYARKCNISFSEAVVQLVSSGINNLENNNAIGGDNTSNNSGNTSNESSNTGNNVQQQ